MTDDLDLGPSVLQPAPPAHPDRLARLLLWPLLTVLFFTTIVFYVLYSPLRVVGDSMDPTLHNGYRLLRTKGYSQPHRGDVVIVDAELSSESDDIVKRVIAVAGDTIEVRDDRAIVNGEFERRGSLMLLQGQGENWPKTTVPEGHVFVMGDNRPVSYDSRMIGPVPMTKIRGQAVFIFAPIYAIRSL